MPKSKNNNSGHSKHNETDVSRDHFHNDSHDSKPSHKGEKQNNKIHSNKEKSMRIKNTTVAAALIGAVLSLTAVSVVSAGVKPNSLKPVEIKSYKTLKAGKTEVKYSANDQSYTVKLEKAAKVEKMDGKAENKCASWNDKANKDGMKYVSWSDKPAKDMKEASWKDKSMKDGKAADWDISVEKSPEKWT